MDAQHVAGSDHDRPAGASTQQRPGPVGTDYKQSKSPSAVRASSPSRHSMPKTTAAPAAAAAADDAALEDRDSDAETMVLPGKDGHSPSKARKVRQEDNNGSEFDAAKTIHANGDGKSSREAGKLTGSWPNHIVSGSRPGHGGKRKSPSTSTVLPIVRDAQQRRKVTSSNGLSPAPNSPPHHQLSQTDDHGRRRRTGSVSSSLSDPEHPNHHKSSKAYSRENAKANDRGFSHMRKSSEIKSEDEGDMHKARRQRTTSAGLESGRHKEMKAAHAPRDNAQRSVSPPPRPHRRSVSTQLPSQSSVSHGLASRKRRLPPPLQPSDYVSDESSMGGSPQPYSSKARSLATPASTDANISPAKIGPHKKHLDAHGQTHLARACARGEYEAVKQRLRERPEDLNVADYAGNTPLQIAAINGCEDIVKLLIDTGCNLDCVNYDKDTPLLDAVDNGHLGVVTLLLDAGVDPRKANVNGQEPLERVGNELDNAQEIRAALLNAIKQASERRKTPEDGHPHADDQEARDSHAPESPRPSPAAAASGNTASTSRRGGAVRSNKTRNDLLYMPLNEKTLRRAAGLGDIATVANILQVKDGSCDDPESMVAAARGGYDLVMQLLLGLGGANADPGPVASLPREFATPILAAIGRGNIKIVELLLEQQGFDPTRRFKGETYYEIARKRQGPHWKDEEQMLKNAYDEFKNSRTAQVVGLKDNIKSKAFGARRERDRVSHRDDAADEAKSHKHRLSTASRESELRRKPTKMETSRRSSLSKPTKWDDEAQKKGSGTSKKEPSAVSDREPSPALSHKVQKATRAETDVAAGSSDGEVAKPRRKLVSKGELRGERDKQKRGSTHKSVHSPRESRSDGVSWLERHQGRSKTFHRDDSKETMQGEGTAKRHRTSLTPDRPSDADKDHREANMKRRRLDVDGVHDGRQKRSSLEDGRRRKSSSSRDGSAKPAATASARREHDDNVKGDSESRNSGQSGFAKSIHVKSEDVDTPMPDLEPARLPERREAGKASHEGSADMKRQEAEAQAQAESAREKEEEVRKRKEAEESRKLKEAEAAEREKVKVAQEAERERRKRQEDEEAKRHKQQQEERERREATQREEEEKRRRLEELRRKREGEERKRREEEERTRRVQAEREAAEEAQRQREEQERKERERRERAHREEMDRKRAAREAELRRNREEQERARLDKLPPLLRWLAVHPEPKLGSIAENFRFLLGIRYDTIHPQATGTAKGREQWVLNTDVAVLLGEKDLNLSRYTGWERVPVSHLAKRSLWRTEGLRYSLVGHRFWNIGRQLPGCYREFEPSALSVDARRELGKAARERFEALDMFFVKLSDFLYTVPTIPHLRSIRLGVLYHELPEHESQLYELKRARKWTSDPDIARFKGFAPRHKYYVNGIMVEEELPKTAKTSKTPFPEKRVPRRGLLQVYPDDPEYERICKEQGLDHLVQNLARASNSHAQSPSPTVNTTLSPSETAVDGADEHSSSVQVNGTHDCSS